MNVYMNKRDLDSFVEHGDDERVEWTQRLERIEQSIRELREEVDAFKITVFGCPRELFYCNKTRKNKTEQNRTEF